MNNNIYNFNNANTGKPETWYSLVGDNGFGITTLDGVIIEAVHKLRNLSMVAMPNEEMARNYALSAYFGRFIMRNHAYGCQPQIPINIPANIIYYDPYFDEREGNRLSYLFPGINI